MKAFMDENFLLDTDTARTLFFEAARDLPIIDYHCHLSPREIWQNRPFENITQVWLGGDHYKWRLMRAAGVDERFITGDAPDREKFQKWAETLSLAIGNPLYHWSHMELRRFFDFDAPLNARTAGDAWQACNRKLAGAQFAPRALIERMRVETLCTTDDPADDLIYHQRLRAQKDFAVNVLPAWRPDNALNIEKSGFAGYMQRLGAAAGVTIDGLDDLKAALRARMGFFHQNGCRLSDHGLARAMLETADEARVEAALKKALSGEAVSPREALAYKTALMLYLGGEYNRLGWTMQLHYGALRDNNPAMFARLGPDTGFDAIDGGSPSEQLAGMLGAFGGALPKTIVYSLNPNDDDIVGSVIACFQNGRGYTRIQQGSAWWFNDHLDGMRKQLRALAAQGFLSGFVGMLTDSRSFLSYPRHEYFRRILCALLGQWVEQGLYPADMDALEHIVRAVCYENAKAYFNFPKKDA